jgi:hypothetical protein
MTIVHGGLIKDSELMEFTRKPKDCEGQASLNEETVNVVSDVHRSCDLR